MKKRIALVLLLAACAAAPALRAAEKPQAGEEKIRCADYHVTRAVFYGSGIDTSRRWNICTGATDGGVEVHMTQHIVPIRNCPGEYAVVRKYTDKGGALIKYSVRRLKDCGSVSI